MDDTAEGMTTRDASETRCYTIFTKYTSGRALRLLVFSTVYSEIVLLRVHQVVILQRSLRLLV